MKKSIKSNCKSRIRKCTYSPKLNVQDVKIPINSEVNADSSEAELQQIMDDIKSAISTKLHRIMTSEFGFEDSEVDDYSRVDVSSVNLGEDHEETIRVEVRVELSYNGMEKVKDALDPIIESYDSYAYFDFDDPGIMSAYVRLDEVDMSVYGSEDEVVEYGDSEYTNRYVTKYRNKSYIVYDNSNSVNLPQDADIEALQKWKAQVTQQASAYNADRDYQRAKIENGVIYYYRNGKLEDKSYYMSPSDWDIEQISEWSEAVINEAIENLYEANKDVPDKMIHNSKSVQSATDEFIDLSILSDSFVNAYTAAVEDFLHAYQYADAQVFLIDDPNSDKNEVCAKVCGIDSKGKHVCGKVYFDRDEEYYEQFYQAFDETAEAIGMEPGSDDDIEMSTDSKDDKVFVEDIIDELEDNGYDLSRIRSIRQGLLELFGYKGKDADTIIHDLIAGRFIDPNDWIDKDYTPGIYSATDDGEGYWFFTTHGVQPGSVPKDADILDIIDTPNGSFVKFDRFLSTEELNEYDMKERAPKSVMSSESGERRAEDNPWVQEIDWVMSQLPSWFEVDGSNLEYDVTYDGQTVHVEFFLFDGAKYTYYIDGHGPYTTNQSERIGSDIEDYINEKFEDIMSATEEEYDEEELQDIIDELTADGFDVTDEADLLMGLGADLGMDRADARYYAKLILNHMDDSSVLGSEEDEDSLPMVDQEYDSAATSINSSKLPAIYKMINLEPGGLYVDFGGGRWDNAVEYIKDKGATLVVYDPYNRSAEHNKEVLRILRENGGADAAVNSNVLNVIKEPEARKNVLENIARITKPGAPIYITVYEGKGDGQEGPTKSGYQLNRKTADYLEEIQEVFPDATRKGKLIIAHNSGSVNSSTVAGAESTREYDEPVELEDSEEIIEVDIDVDIYVEDDGEILYENEEKRSDYNWASSDLRGGSWSMNDYPSIVIRNPDDVADDIMDIIYPNIPTRPGRYHISGTAELYYDISGLLTYGDPFGILHDEDIISDNLEVNFNYGKSYIDNLEIKIVDK